MNIEIYNFIAQNKELLRLFYSIIIALICFVIVIKTNRLFRISSHQGIRYFRNAFLFYGFAFVFRYLIANPISINLIKIVFEFFMIMGGFFLLYSLLWKKFEKIEPSISSLLNSKIFLFYVLAIIIAILDYLWKSYNFMFFSQIILFAFASIISYKNYENKKERNFLKFYFVVMVLSFLAWIGNFVFVCFLGGRLRWLANVYVLNVIFFLIFLYGVMKITKPSKSNRI